MYDVANVIFPCLVSNVALMRSVSQSFPVCSEGPSDCYCNSMCFSCDCSNAQSVPTSFFTIL